MHTGIQTQISHNAIERSLSAPFPELTSRPRYGLTRDHAFYWWMTRLQEERDGKKRNAVLGRKFKTGFCLRAQRAKFVLLSMARPTSPDSDWDRRGGVKPVHRYREDRDTVPWAKDSTSRRFSFHPKLSPKNLPGKWKTRESMRALWREEHPTHYNTKGNSAVRERCIWFFYEKNIFLIEP